MRAIVLAGGLGTRLRERVPDLPKPMAPIAGRPFLEYVLDGLLGAEVDEIVLAVGYKAESIQSHFGTTYRGLPIRYSVETSPLGTGGAIMQAISGNDRDASLVLNGDTLLRIDYRALMAWYRQQPVQVAMVLRRVEDVSRYGAVLLEDGRVSGFAEKGRSGPGLINAGIYIVNAELFTGLGLPRQFSFEADVLQAHCSSLAPRAYVADCYFIDIGVPESLDRAQRELPRFYA